MAATIPSTPSNIPNAIITALKAVTDAKTPSEKITSLNAMSEIFKNKAHPFNIQTSKLFNEIKSLDIPDTDKKEIYEIAAKAVFSTACINTDKSEIEAFIHTKFQKHPQTPQSLITELEWSSECLTLISENERDIELVKQAIGFPSGLNPEWRDIAKREINQIPDFHRKYFFDVRRKPLMIETLKLFSEKNQMDALLKLVPMYKKLADENKIRSIINILKLFKQEDCYNALWVLVSIFYLRSNNPYEKKEYDEWNIPTEVYNAIKTYPPEERLKQIGNIKKQIEPSYSGDPWDSWL